MKPNNRIEMLQKKLQKENLDGAVYTIGASFVYLLKANRLDWQRMWWTNIENDTHKYEDLTSPECLLYVPQEGEALVLSSYRYAGKLKEIGIKVTETFFDRFSAVLARVIQGKNIAVGTFAKSHLEHIVKEANPDCQIYDGENLVAAMRYIKEPEEIALMENAAKLTDKAMAAIIDMLKPGVTADEVETFFGAFGRVNGISDLSFPPTCCVVKTGSPEASSIDGRPKSAPLEEGCGIAFDLGYLLDGYCSDFGRSFYYGEAPQKLKDAYSALQAGQLNMINKIVPGKTNINQLYGFVKEVVDERGFGDVLRFPETGMLGHQIGIDCHEHPMVNNTVDFILQPNMVFCSEPKIWLEGEMYMRVEDMVLVTETGARSLTEFDRALFELPVKK